MKAEWIRKAAALPVRQLHLAGGGLLLISCAAFWFYGVRAPLAQLRTLRAEHARLHHAGGDPRLLAAQLAVLDSDSSALARRLGNAPTGPATPLLVQLISDISKLAAVHQVSLQGATPAEEQKAVLFEQIGIDAEASGQYASLLAWMDAIERAGPNLAIDRFEMRRAEAPGQVHIKLRIAAYRPLKSTP